MRLPLLGDRGHIAKRQPVILTFVFINHKIFCRGCFTAVACCARRQLSLSYATVYRVYFSSV